MENLGLSRVRRRITDPEKAKDSGHNQSLGEARSGSMLSHAASSPASGNWLDWPVFSQRMIRHLPLLLLVAAFFVLEFTYPRFPDMDHETYFKAAGWNAIQKGAFAAPELEGYRHLDPPIERVYFTYPPLYTWLFGQWSRVTGFCWAACGRYHALISVLLAFIVYGLRAVGLAPV